MSEVIKTEYLYGTHTGEDLDGYVKTRVIPFRIVKKTAKRIFYVADWIHGETDRLGSVDRKAIEETGEVYNRARGWWSPDFHLTAEPPTLNDAKVLDLSALKEELRRLRAEVSDAHPDRGGDQAAFIAAYQRYIDAKQRFARLLGGAG